ncbi:MAG: thioredoxin family protein [Candidatus Methanofastidiosia archaeon]
MKFFKSKDCPNCPRAQKNLEELLSELGIDTNVSYFDISTTEGRIEALNNMVMESPAIVIDEEHHGKDVLLDKKKLRSLLAPE